MHRIASVEEGLWSRRDVRVTRIRGERQDLHIRPGRIDDALEHESDGQRVVLNGLDDFLVARLSMCFQPDVGTRPFDDCRIPLLAALECLPLDEIRPVAQGEVGAMHMDGLVRPFAGETKLAPGPDVRLGPARRRGRPLRAVPSTRALRAEDAVDLR